MNENEIGDILIDTAFYLHRNLGSGLYESVYEAVLAKLLSKKGLHVQRQVAVPIEFEGEYFDEGFRLDLFIERKVIVELKSIEKITDTHKKQLLTYLKLTGSVSPFLRESSWSSFFLRVLRFLRASVRVLPSFPSFFLRELRFLRVSVRKFAGSTPCEMAGGHMSLVYLP